MKNVRTFSVGLFSSIQSKVILPAWSKAEFLHSHNWNRSFLLAQIARPKKNHNKKLVPKAARKRMDLVYSLAASYPSYLCWKGVSLNHGLPGWLRHLASVSFCQFSSGCIIWMLAVPVFSSCHQVCQKQPAMDNKAPWFRKKWVMETFNGVKQI